MMAAIASAIIIILLIGPVEAASQETVEQILVQTEEAYKNLETYHFRGTISYEWMGEDKSIQVPHNSFQTFRGKGGKLRHQSGIGMSKVLAATDGTRSLLYLADKGQYKYSDYPDLEEFIRQAWKLENAAWIFPAISLLDKYKNLRTRFHDPKLRSLQVLKVNGESVHCYVLEGVMEPSDIDAVRGNPVTELWIHKDRHLVLREIHRGTSTDLPIKGGNLTETIAFNIAETDTVPPDAIFEFRPPQRSQLVKEFFTFKNSPGDEAVVTLNSRAHSFYYELPFLKMKHFRLPTVEGEELALGKFRGKYVLLDFWATWCVPCHKQMKDLEKVLRKYEGKDLAVLGLNNEELDVTRSFLGERNPNYTKLIDPAVLGLDKEELEEIRTSQKERNPSYPLLIDVDGEIASLYGVKNLPVLILLDRSGNIICKKSERQTYEQMDKLLMEAGL